MQSGNVGDSTWDGSDSYGTETDGGQPLINVQTGKERYNPCSVRGMSHTQPFIEPESERAGEMSQYVQCLLGKSEDLRLNKILGRRDSTAGKSTCIQA